MKKCALHNLGCKVNSYETQVMQQMMEEAGYEIVEFGKEPADVYIINTCSVTNIADRKSRQMIHKAKKLNPDAIVAATGCYVEAAGDNVDEDVDIAIGNNEKSRLVEILDSYFSDVCEEKHTHADINKVTDFDDMFMEAPMEHTRAYVKIQDGCNRFCTYCIIPYVRGRIRSRQRDDIFNEVSSLARKGCAEVVLTGIHLSSYGLDMGDDALELIDIIEMINGIEGIKRIRLGSLEPRIVTEEFAKRLAACEKICPHFHLSLQSGCDATLIRMNRKYTTGEFAEGVKILRRYFDNPAITTDVIVGFPGETQEEFDVTYEGDSPSTAGLQKGQMWTLRQLLYALMLPSGNDAAYVIAAGVARSIKGNENLNIREQLEYFNNLMNNVAKKIGAHNSHFMVPDGNSYYNSDGSWSNRLSQHYVTADDMIKFAMLALNYSMLAKVVSTYTINFSIVSEKAYTFYNTNLLIKPIRSEVYLKNAIGIKTGTTNPGGYCLICAYEVDGRIVIASILKGTTSMNRYYDAVKIYNAVYN